MNIGFFGGSFDPPHLGHLRSAESFIREAALSLLYIIPTHVSPFKRDKKNVSPDADRLKMCALNFSCLQTEDTQIFVSDIEAKRKGTSYTIDTIKELCALHPDDNLYIYVGTDMFLSLERWKDCEEIFSRCTVFTKARNINDLSLLNVCADKYKNKYNANVIISAEKELVCSSTEIRHLLSENNILNLKNLLTDEVFGYIIKNKLYSGNMTDE